MAFCKSTTRIKKRIEALQQQRKALKRPVVIIKTADESGAILQLYQNGSQRTAQSRGYKPPPGFAGVFIEQGELLE